MSNAAPFDSVLTGDFWDLTDPKKSVGEFDPADIIDIPFNWVAFLAGITDTYGSHVMILGVGLSEVTSANVAGVITARIKKDPLVALTVGTKYSVTCRITTTNGQKKDMTGYLKVREM